MKPSDAFGVVVRSIGLLLFLQGIAMCLVAVGAPGMILLAIPALVVGLWLLRGAQFIVSFAYPDETAESRVTSHEDIE